MSTQPKERGELSESDTVKRRDNALQRALNTPRNLNRNRMRSPRRSKRRVRTDRASFCADA